MNRPFRAFFSTISLRIAKSLFFVFLAISAQASFLQSLSAAELECSSPSPTPVGLLEGVEEAYKKTTSLSAEFVQNSLFIGLEKQEASKGTVDFFRPGKMNWNYLQPTPQQFISDGSTIYFYQPSLNQVTLSSFKQSFSSDLPVTFLLGLGSLRSSFEAQGICKGENGTIIKLAPKSEDAALSSFFLLVDKKALTPLGAKVVDLGGNETTITLISPRFNADIPASRFDFRIPKGVDVIDNRSASATPQVGITDSGPRSVKEDDLIK